MKTFNYIFAILAAGALLASCGEKEDAYVWGEEENANCYGVTFPDQTVCDYELDPEDPAASVVTVKAHRAVTTGDITVPIVIRQVPFDDEYVFAHTDLKFADGESDATFQVSFTNAEVGKEYECHITIEDPEYGSLYKKEVNFISFSFMKVKWTTLATGTLNSAFFGALASVPKLPGVVLQHCETFPEKYRLVDPFHSGVDFVFNTIGDEKVDGDGDKYYSIVLPMFDTGLTYGSYGAIYAADYYTVYGEEKIDSSVFYPDYNQVYIGVSWSVSAGTLYEGTEAFIPDGD